MKDFKTFTSGAKSIEMKKYLDIDNDRVKKMLDIKLKVFNRELTPDEARALVNKIFDSITAEEFAYGEQHLYDAGITDEIMAEGMDDILDVFKDVLVATELNLPQGHPIQTYADEGTVLKKLVSEMELKLKAKFIKNEWLERYTKLSQINTHFSRKQHQLFSALERKGFDRPSKIMWTFDDRVRDAIKDAFELLKADKDSAFLEAQPHVIHLVRDILQKESDVLYPTSLKLITDEEFAQMRISDDEIGYCLIDNPPMYNGLEKGEKPESADTKAGKEENLLNDLKAVFEKHGIANSAAKDDLLDVTTGRLTLEQINLIYKHLEIDLSFVDENDEVRFYTDTKHRIFPRSAGVIGRKVQNCHPRESLHQVEAIINAFRNKEQDKAEFWLDRGEKFIYITFTALRDEKGNYRGTLEAMQEVSRIRGLEGSQRLLSWSNEKPAKVENEEAPAEIENSYGITPETVIGPLLKQYPFVKEFLVSLSPHFKKLENPVLFFAMKDVASLSMISQVSGMKVNNLVQKIVNEIISKT